MFRMNKQDVQDIECTKNNPLHLVYLVILKEVKWKNTYLVF